MGESSENWMKRRSEHIVLIWNNFQTLVTGRDCNVKRGNSTIHFTFA